MGKLIELIANFMKEIGNPTYEISKYHYDDELKLIVVSQNNTTFIDSIDIYRLFFGSDFIQRLVDNNKINKRKIDTRLVRYVENHYDEEGYWVESSYEDYSDTNTLLMLLSISDTPIEDLISYLK